MTAFAGARPDHIMNRMVMPLVGIPTSADGQIAGTEGYVAGTAFHLGKGWALTAYHVIEELHRRFDVHSVDGPEERPFAIISHLRGETPTEFAMLKVVRMWHAEPADLALLYLQRADDVPTTTGWPVPRLSLRPPRVGTPVHAFGFARGQISIANPANVTLAAGAYVSTGTVLEIHHDFRDRAMLNFPCFQTDTRFDPGMSGGPVFDNTTGHVCGVVCSSLPGATSQDSDVSYASTLWPMAAIHVDEVPSANGAAPTPAITLFEKGILRAVDFSCIRVWSSGDSVMAHASYDREEWSRPVREQPQPG